jgi:hypothetical protein
MDIMDRFKRKVDMNVEVSKPISKYPFLSDMGRLHSA